MTRKRRYIGYPLVGVLVAGLLLSRMTGWWSVVGYAVLSLFLSALAACVLLRAYRVEVMQRGSKPRKWAVVGVLAISLIAGAACFEHLMTVHVLVAYDSTRELAIVVVDGIIVELGGRGRGGKGDSSRRDVRRSFARSATVGLVTNVWEMGDEFRVEAVGLGAVQVRAVRNEVVYKKNRSLTVNGRGVPLYTGRWDRLWGYAKLITASGDMGDGER